MQTFILKVTLKRESTKKEPLNLYHKTGQNQRNVGKDKIEQIKGQKANSTNRHSYHQLNDSRTWWSDCWDWEIKKGDIENLEWEDPGNREWAAAKESGGREKAAYLKRKVERAKAKRNQNKIAQEIDTTSYFLECAQKAASAIVRRYEIVSPSKKYKASLKMMIKAFIDLLLKVCILSFSINLILALL